MLSIEWLAAKAEDHPPQKIYMSPAKMMVDIQ
jgi:hypothetical protein